MVKKHSPYRKNQKQFIFDLTGIKRSLIFRSLRKIWFSSLYQICIDVKKRIIGTAISLYASKTSKTFSSIVTDMIKIIKNVKKTPSNLYEFNIAV